MARVIFTKEPQEFNKKLAEALKQIPEFEVPEWMAFVKSGVSKERPPMEDDFWHIRAASILRQLYIHGVVGVGRLRTRYGSKKNRGGRRDKFFKASGKIIRAILQQAEKAGFVEKVDRLQYGRRLTQKGKDFLDSIEVTEKPRLMDSYETEIRSVKVEDNVEELNEEGGQDGEQEAEEQEQ